VKLEKYDWDKGQNVPYRVNEKIVEKFVNFMLNSRAWHEDLDIVHKKVRELRRDVAYVPAAKEAPKQAS
jgi:hypothetical protein